MSLHKSSIIYMRIVYIYVHTQYLNKECDTFTHTLTHTYAHTHTHTHTHAHTHTHTHTHTHSHIDVKSFFFYFFEKHIYNIFSMFSIFQCFFMNIDVHISFYSSKGDVM